MKARILDQIAIPGRGTVSLYDWMADEVRNGGNLIMEDEDGNERWRAEPLVGPADCFVSVAADGQTLFANSWSGYRCSIDLDTGAVTVLSFTK